MDRTRGETTHRRHPSPGREPTRTPEASPTSPEEMTRAELVQEVEALRLRLDGDDENPQALEEAEIRESSRARFAELWDLSPVGCIVTDGYGIIREANATATRALGVERTWLMGRPLLAYTADGYRGKLVDHLHRCGAQEEPVSTVLSLQPRGGEPLRVRLITRPVGRGSTKRYQTAVAMEEGSGHEEDRPPSEELERTARVLGERTEQLRTLALRLTQAEQQERRNLAQLLHDDLQGLLVGVWMQVDRLRGLEPQAIPDKLEGILDTVTQAIDESRSLSRQLSPRVVYEEGLSKAVEWLASNQREQLDLEVHLEMEPDADVASDDVRAFLFQAVRELLLNVAKHAGTAEAWIRTRATEDGALEIEVEDQGRGTEPKRLEARRDAPGFGLSGMDERLTWLGGGITVDSELGRGTRVTIRVPTAQDHEKASPTH